MLFRGGFSCIAMLALVPACSGSDNDGAGGSGASSGNSGNSGSAASGAACTRALTHVDVPLSGSASSGPVYGAATADGSTAFSWSDGKSVFLTRVDAAGKPLGADFSVSGLHVHGLAPSSDG